MPELIAQLPPGDIPAALADLEHLCDHLYGLFWKTGQPDSRTAGQPDSRTAGQPDSPGQSEIRTIFEQTSAPAATESTPPGIPRDPRDPPTIAWALAIASPIA